MLEAALTNDQPRFAREAALHWLSTYPGDLQVSLCYTRALLAETKTAQALPILKGLCQADPEFVEAVVLLHEAETTGGILISKNRSQNTLEVSRTDLAHSAMSTDTSASSSADWVDALIGPSGEAKRIQNNAGYTLHRIRKSLDTNDITAAEIELPQVLATNRTNPLVAVTHLKILEANPHTPLSAKRSMAEFYHRRWPDCLTISLLLGSWWLKEGDFERAVALLHQVAARDLGGQCVHRLWGKDHPYRNLWAETLEIKFDEPIPAGVAAGLGLNILSSGPVAEATVAPKSIVQAEIISEEIAATSNFTDDEKASRTPATSEVSVEFKAVLTRMAHSLKNPSLAQSDGRFPIYVILTLRSRLEAVYGPEAAQELIHEMQALTQSVRDNAQKVTNARWGACLFTPDTPENMALFGIKPAKSLDPWALKLALADLDGALSKRGEMIGALLIAGGPEIVPHHLLPNPIDDLDQDVPSDNPYGSRDENYFITEWPVGRLPGGSTSDSSVLLEGLRRIKQNYVNPSVTNGNRWNMWLSNWRSPRSLSSFGYSAAVWKNASADVFNPIGEARKLRVSPPMGLNGTAKSNGKQSSRFTLKRILPIASSKNGHGNIPTPNGQLAYFNLHGLVDAPEWYGQRAPEQNGEIDYPIALRPQDLQNSEQDVPKVVFSEACYGAYIVNKAVDQSMALQFLKSGCQAVVGSSVMAYGAIRAPLIAADLLGYLFWKGLKAGLPAGEALRQAKIMLASKMHERQGYLDGEDQKTLISFMLLGDPLARIKVNPNSRAKLVVRSLESPTPVTTVCDRQTETKQDQNQEIPPEIISYVKRIVSNYLPGMQDARLAYTCERADCTSHEHSCPTNQLNTKTIPSKPPARQLVTLSKTIENGSSKHHQIARLTLDASGKLVKLVVSR